MGYSMRTDRYRLVEWSCPGKSFAEYELYDHRTDPDEDINLAAKPEYAKLVKELADQLHEGWRGPAGGSLRVCTSCVRSGVAWFERRLSTVRRVGSEGSACVPTHFIRPSGGPFRLGRVLPVWISHRTLE